MPSWKQTDDAWQSIWKLHVLCFQSKDMSCVCKTTNAYYGTEPKPLNKNGTAILVRQYKNQRTCSRLKWVAHTKCQIIHLCVFQEKRCTTFLEGVHPGWWTVKVVSLELTPDKVVSLALTPVLVNIPFHNWLYQMQFPTPLPMAK